MAIKTYFSSTGSWAKRAAFVALFGAMSSMLVACGGSGTASTTPAPPPPAPPVIPFAVFPAAQDVFPDIPFDFTINGGTGPYSVASSNPVVVSAPTVTGSSTTSFKFTVVAKNVVADTPVIITARDSLGATTTLTLNVRASTLNNVVTLTPVAPTGTGCAGLCSGGDAQVDVTAVLNGVKLTNRPIRFDVSQGDFRFVTPGTNTLVTSIVVNTDENGVARVRLQALVTAPTQVAIFTSTDTVTGLVRRTNFVIAQVTSGVGILSILPAGGVTFTGARPPAVQAPTPVNLAQCPFGEIIDHYIYGGTPPYQVVSPLPTYLTVSPSEVLTNGGSYRVTQSGCGVATLVITDAQKRSLESPTVTSVLGPAGDATPAATPTSLTVTPSGGTLAAPNHTLNTCNDVVTSATSGFGTYTTTATKPGIVDATPSAGTIGSAGGISFQRSKNTNVLTLPANVTVNVTAGTIVQSVFIAITGPANCPPPP